VSRPHDTKTKSNASAQDMAMIALLFCVMAGGAGLAFLRILCHADPPGTTRHAR
jgi:hypothetical protein